MGFALDVAGTRALEVVSVLTKILILNTQSVSRKGNGINMGVGSFFKIIVERVQVC